MTEPATMMPIGIIGTGPIGLGSGALLAQRGYKTMLWSPKGSLTPKAGATIKVTGALDFQYLPAFAENAKILAASCNIILVAVPAYGHKNIFDKIGPHITPDHTIIISSHVPFSAEYLRSRLSCDPDQVQIIAFSTTVVSGRKTAPNKVHLGTVRNQIDIATLPASGAAQGFDLCRRLFGDRFVLRDNLLTIALSNLNPQNHLGITLCNMTRIESGEKWVQTENTTPAVGRLLERLDEERRAIANAVGVQTRDIYEHFSRSFHVPPGSVAEMSAAMLANGHKGFGPSDPKTRYVWEDVPYGLVPAAWLGRLVGAPAELHEAGIRLFNALYGQDFFQGNAMMEELKTLAGGETELLELVRGEKTSEIGAA